MALNVLSRAAFEKGNPEEGLRLAYESAAIAETVGFTWWHGITLVGAAEYLIAAGDTANATHTLRAGLPSLTTVNDRVNLPIALAASAALAAQQQDPERAGLLWGTVEAAAETEPRATTDRALTEYESYLDPVRGAAFDQARQHGHTLTIDEAINHALDTIQP
jgi:hypothetical protein